MVGRIQKCAKSRAKFCFSSSQQGLSVYYMTMQRRASSASTPLRRKSMSENMLDTVEKRKQRNAKRTNAEAGGWERVDLDDKNLKKTYEPEVIDSCHVLAQLDIPRDAKAAEIFLRIFPKEFMDDWLKDLKRDYPGSFVKFQGKGRNPTTRNYTVSKMYQSLAMQILIHGRQEKPLENTANRHALEAAFKKSVVYLRENSDGLDIIGYDTARRLQSLMCLIVGTKLEKAISDNFSKLLAFPGEVIACDEKVFVFDNDHSGYVRVIKAKNQKGLWNYTACVWIAEGLPFMIYTRCHTALASLEERISCHEIINDWIELAQMDAPRPPILVMDAYYLSRAGLHDMREAGVYFICSIQKGRFPNMCSLLDAKVQKTGDRAFAIREVEGEATELLTLFSSPDNRIKRRWTITNALIEHQKVRRKHHTPGFDEYEKNFAGCDVFNRKMKDKSWPHKYTAGVYSLELRAGHSYLMTCALENTFHAWKSANLQMRSQVYFLEFTQILAKQLIQKYHQ